MAVLDTGGNAAPITFAFPLSGSGGLAKSGLGTLTLTCANAHSGDTTITDGTLVLTNANALQNSTLDYNLYAGTLDIGSLTELVLGGLKGTHPLSLTNGNSAAVALTIGGNNQSVNCGNLLSGTGSLTKVGSGTLTISNIDTYTGPTTIKDGTLQISFANRLPTGTTVTLANVAGATLDINGWSQTIAVLNGGGDIGGTVSLGAGRLLLEVAPSRA